MTDVLTTTTTRPNGAGRRLPTAWQYRGFRQLCGAWVFTNLADSALFLMVAVWVKELTGSDSAAALVFAMLGIPSLLAPFLGQVADRLSRKWLLVGSYAVVAVVVALLLLVDSPAGLWLVYVVMLVYATVAYLTAAAQSGLVRDLLPDEHLGSGNGLLTTIDQSLRLVSPLLGAALYAAFGPGSVIVLTAASFLVAAGLLAMLRLVESPPETADQRGSYWNEVTAGFRHVFAHPVLGRLTLVAAVGFGATGLINVAALPAIERGLHLPAAALGPLVSVQGVGAVLAGLTAARAIRRWGETRVFGMGMVGLALGTLPFMGTSLVAVVLGLALVGGSVTWSVVAFVTLRQRLTAPRMQGRTSAAVNVAFNLPQTVFTLGGAAVLAVLDYRILVAATALCVLASMVLLPRRRVSPEASGSGTLDAAVAES